MSLLIVRLISVFWYFSIGHAFVTIQHLPSRYGVSITSTFSSSSLFMVLDPISILASAVDIDVGVAVASAAVGALSGAASQIPKMKRLEQDLAATKKELDQKEDELRQKMNALEEKVFLMDQEYESQTTKFKKQYDTTMQKQILEVTDKVKSDLEFTYQIKLEQQRSNMLSDKLKYENDRTNRAQSIAEMNIKTSRLEDTNAILTKALNDAELELQRIRNASKTSSSKFKGFGFGKSKTT